VTASLAWFRRTRNRGTPSTTDRAKATPVELVTVSAGLRSTLNGSHRALKLGSVQRSPPGAPAIAPGGRPLVHPFPKPRRPRVVYGGVYVPARNGCRTEIVKHPMGRKLRARGRGSRQSASSDRLVGSACCCIVRSPGNTVWAVPRRRAPRSIHDDRTPGYAVGVEGAE